MNYVHIARPMVAGWLLETYNERWEFLDKPSNKLFLKKGSDPSSFRCSDTVRFGSDYNVCYLCSADARFESRPGHLLS